MRVADRIHRIEVPLGQRYVALYLLLGDEHSLLVDTGLAESIPLVVEPYLRRKGIDPGRIDHVLSTHGDFDHIGGNAAARELFPAARFIAHRYDRSLIEDVEVIVGERYGEFVEGHDYDDVSASEKSFIRAVTGTTSVDWAIVGGEELRLSSDWVVELLHTPGHSRGSVSVWDPLSKTLIVGDAVLGAGLMTRNGTPAFPPTYRHVESYRSTIDRLEGMHAETLATSHYPVYRGDDVNGFLSLSRTYAHRVETAILHALRESADPVTTVQIVSRIHPGLGSWPDGKEYSLMSAVVGHLEWLAAYGEVSSSESDGIVTWSIVP